MNHRSQKLHPPLNEAGRAPKFLPGDPVIDDEDGASGRVEFSRADGMCCIVWSTGSREWVHEDSIQWPPDFEPSRRR